MTAGCKCDAAVTGAEKQIRVAAVIAAQIQFQTKPSGKKADGLAVVIPAGKLA